MTAIVPTVGCRLHWTIPVIATMMNDNLDIEARAMAFENDPEGYEIACGYAGRDFDKSKVVTIEAFSSYGDTWDLNGFKQAIDDAIDSIPPECRERARVELESGGGDYSGNLKISYCGPESAATVADRVRRCKQYVAERRRSELATYEALKKKFG